MVLRVNSLALQLMRYIGGVYMNPVYEGTARPACTAVPREVQRRALREALALTADLGWIDRQGVSKNVYNRVQACEYLQRRIARTLLEKLGTLDLAASKADDPYTADLMAKDLVAWFEERLRSREPLTDHVRNLQQSLLKSTVAAANVKDKPSSGSGSAFALFDGSASLSDGGDLFPATDAGALPDSGGAPGRRFHAVGRRRGAGRRLRLPDAAGDSRLPGASVLRTAARHEGDVPAGRCVGSLGRYAQFLPLHGRPDRPGAGGRMTLTNRQAATFRLQPACLCPGRSARLVEDYGLSG